jgi:hypothetical protein
MHFSSAVQLWESARQGLVLPVETIQQYVSGLAARAGGVHRECWTRYLKLARALDVPWAVRLRTALDRRLPCPGAWCGRHEFYESWRSQMVGWYEMFLLGPMNINSDTAPPAVREGLVVFRDNVLSCAQFDGSLLLVFIENVDKDNARITSIFDISFDDTITVAFGNNTEMTKFEDTPEPVPVVRAHFKLKDVPDILWGQAYESDKPVRDDSAQARELIEKLAPNTLSK